MGDKMRQAITTKYLSPTNTLCSRVVATGADRQRVVVVWDYGLSTYENHKQAALALCRKMKWSGTLYAGGTQTGYVFIFTTSYGRVQKFNYEGA